MKARILIVDDAAFMRMILRKILIAGGFEVVGEAENGVQAVSKYLELRPSLTTMDITMKEKSGIEALRDIINKDPTALVVMCSAMGQQSLVVEAVQAGAKDFIVKPFQANKVIETVKKILVIA